MKLLIASDIHGSAYWCGKLMEAYEKEHPNQLILLGDLLYHGPRNDLPREYCPQRVADMLNSVSNQILAVRGNCDSEVDQMVLDFPMMADSAMLYFGSRRVFATHGHVFSPENPPKLHAGDVLLSGHVHLQLCGEKDGIQFLNPGSVSIPKGDSTNGYLLYEDGLFRWMNLDGTCRMEYRM